MKGHFNVANQDGKVVKITMNKTNYKIGDKIIGFLDFSDAQVPCVEVIFFFNKNKIKKKKFFF